MLRLRWVLSSLIRAEIKVKPVTFNKEATVSGEQNTTEGNRQSIEEMLGPCVEIGALEHETDPEKINAVAFELYKETWRVLNLAAHLLDEEANAQGGWPRNQAICAGLLIRMSKFMHVVAQITTKGDRGEIVQVLSRSIMESAINLEFLARTNDDNYFDQFVRFNLGPERELYDIIQANIAARRGEVLPIEQRMLDSINDVCSTSGVKIEEVDRKHRDWAGSLRERLKRLGKEEQYVAMQRGPSHAVHGTWVDLYKHHLEYDSERNVFRPEVRFSTVDERALGPIALFVLDATQAYLQRFFWSMRETGILLVRIDDLRSRLLETGSLHEALISKKE